MEVQIMQPKRVLIPSITDESRTMSLLGIVWAAFVVIGLLLMGIVGDTA